MDFKKLIATALCISFMPMQTGLAAVISGAGNHEVLGNTGLGGANITNTNNSFNMNTDGNNATLGGFTTNTTITWGKLNVDTDQSLKYNTASHTILNKVTEGLSVFAGKVSSTGGGHVIISNPAGMVLDGGTFTMSGPLTLTTKVYGNETYGNFEKAGSYGKKYKNDITIIDSNVMARGELILSTKDGANFNGNVKMVDSNIGVQNGFEALDYMEPKLTVQGNDIIVKRTTFNAKNVKNNLVQRPGEDVNKNGNYKKDNLFDKTTTKVLDNLEAKFVANNDIKIEGIMANGDVKLIAANNVSIETVDIPKKQPIKKPVKKSVKPIISDKQDSTATDGKHQASQEGSSSQASSSSQEGSSSKNTESFDNKVTGKLVIEAGNNATVKSVKADKITVKAENKIIARDLKSIKNLLLIAHNDSEMTTVNAKRIQSKDSIHIVGDNVKVRNADAKNKIVLRSDETKTKFESDNYTTKVNAKGVNSKIVKLIGFDSGKFVAPKDSKIQQVKVINSDVKLKKMGRIYEAQSGKLEDKITDTKNTISGLQDDKLAAQGTIDDIKGDIEDLKATKASLQQKLEKYKRQGKDKKADKIKNKLYGENGVNKQLEAKYQELTIAQDNAADIRQALDNSWEKLNSLEKRLGKLEQKFEADNRYMVVEKDRKNIFTKTKGGITNVYHPEGYEYPTDDILPEPEEEIIPVQLQGDLDKLISQTRGSATNTLITPQAAGFAADDEVLEASKGSFMQQGAVRKQGNTVEVTKRYIADAGQ